MARAHCWQDAREDIEKRYGYLSPEWIEATAADLSATCMLWGGHKGPHKWTPDSAITVQFVEPASKVS